MTNKEESSFLQGIESRLDSLFAEDTKTIQTKDSVIIQTTSKDADTDTRKDDQPEMQTIRISARDIGAGADETREPDASTFADDKAVTKEEAADFQEFVPPKEAQRPSDASSEAGQAPDKSSFISEIEKRFSAIFGEEDKKGGVSEETAKQADRAIEPSLNEIAPDSSEVLQSPLKDLKSIVLSLEWEINDRILEQMDDEINRLYLLYTGDRIIQGLLRILRFVGRYIRVRGARSNQDSINMLMLIYDHLEGVMVSEGMTEDRKHIFLKESIRHYRSWVESIDLEETGDEQTAPVSVEDGKPLEMESGEDTFPQEQKAEPLSESLSMTESQPPAEIAEEPAAEEIVLSEEAPRSELDVVMREPEEIPSEQPLAAADEGQPPAEAAVEAAAEEIVLSEEAPRSELDVVMTETEKIPVLRQTSSGEEMSGHDEALEKTIEAMKDMPPHEAFAYALREIQKTFQAEINTLREEIRMLKKTE